jgi:hypothetical protein
VGVKNNTGRGTMKAVAVRQLDLCLSYIITCGQHSTCELACKQHTCVGQVMLVSLWEGLESEQNMCTGSSTLLQPLLVWQMGPGRGQRSLKAIAAWFESWRQAEEVGESDAAGAMGVSCL